ncbi:hypothetical protein CEXT_61771, partial [Caerostris extrusa]
MIGRSFILMIKSPLISRNSSGRLRRTCTRLKDSEPEFLKVHLKSAENNHELLKPSEIITDERYRLQLMRLRDSGFNGCRCRYFNRKASYLLDPLSQLDFVPQQGDKLLPVNPNSAIFEESFRCRQLLIGITKDEGSPM